MMIFVMIIGAIGFTGTHAYANTPRLTVTVAGHVVDFEGQQPVNLGGHVLVPVRGVFNLMGFQPDWNNVTRTATLFDGETIIIIPVGQPSFTVNGRVVTPEVPAQIIMGRVMIPLRAINEAIGGTSHWDGPNRIAAITPPEAMIERVHMNAAAGSGAASGDAIPEITTSGLANGRVGQAYNHSLQAVGSTPITWSIQSGALPPGLTLNANTGAVTGTPSSSGNFSFTIRAQNRFGSATRALSILIESGQFTVTFNANGGSGTMQPQSFLEGVSQNLRANTFTRTGYSFAGWSTTPTGTVQHTNSQSIVVNTNRTLYAVWTHGYTITFNANGGTGTMQPQVFQRNVAQNLRANTFTRTGYSFAGWRTTPTGTTVEFTNAQNITNHLNRTLYAVWVQGYTVTFNANGGTGTMQPQVFQRNVMQNLRTNTFTRAGYTFAGWRTTPTGTGIEFIDGQNIINNLSRTLYAVWTTGTAPSITTTALANAVLTVPYYQSIQATGSTPMTWSVITGSLPPGLTLIENTGGITGQPTLAGTFTFTVRAQNSAGQTSRQFTLTVTATSTVPNVVGQTQLNATNLLLANGFNVTVTHEFSNTVQSGNVISQTPAANSTLAIGGTVNIVVSQGLAPATAITGVTHSSITQATPFNRNMLTVTVDSASGPRNVTNFTTSSRYTCNNNNVRRTYVYSHNKCYCIVFHKIKRGLSC